jgi:hypothetical protein
MTAAVHDVSIQLDLDLTSVLVLAVLAGNMGHQAIQKKTVRRFSI